MTRRAVRQLTLSSHAGIPDECRELSMVVMQQSTRWNRIIMRRNAGIITMTLA
jgi:hypothetical protein